MKYLLMTEKMLQQSPDVPGIIEMEWNSASEEYASIGKVEYRFALLNEARKNVPEPPAPQEYRTDNTSYLETSIASNYFNTYMVVMNVPERSKWLPGLQKVEQDVPQTFVGSIHRLIFDRLREPIVSPLRMTVTDEGIVYAESCRHQSDGYLISL